MAAPRKGRGQGEDATSPRRLAALEKQLAALELRKAGANYPQIADRLGYHDKSHARKAVMAAIEHLITEPAREVLQLEEARLDAMLMGIWTQARSGNLQAIDRALRIMERRSKLRGLDAPDRVEVVTLDAVEAEIQRLESELGLNDNGGPGVRGTATGPAPGAAGAPEA